MKTVKATMPWAGASVRRFVYCFLLGALSICSDAQDTAAGRKPFSPGNWDAKLHEGDIVFIRSRSGNAALIAALSNVDAAADKGQPGDPVFERADRVFTHCGIAFRGKDGQGKDGWIVYEGAGRGTVLSLADWRTAESTYKDEHGHVVSEPLHNVYVRRWSKPEDLTADALAAIKARAKALHETSYDQGFSWSDKHAYCSELVWKAFASAHLSFGTLPTMSHYVDNVPAAVADRIKGKLEAVKDSYRDGKGYDPGEWAISPEDLFGSSNLISVNDETP